MQWRVPPADIALAGLIGVVSLISFRERSSLLLDTADGPIHFATPDLVGVVQVIIGCAALCWRRVAPGTVLAVTVASAIGRYAEHYPVMPLPYAVLIAVYTVAQKWPLKRSAIAVAAVAVGMAVGAMILLSPSLDDEPMIDAVAVLTAGALGRGVRMRQMRTALLEDRAQLLEEQSRRHGAGAADDGGAGGRPRAGEHRQGAARHRREQRQRHRRAGSDDAAPHQAAAAQRRRGGRGRRRRGALRGAGGHRVPREGDPGRHAPSGGGPAVHQRRVGQRRVVDEGSLAWTSWRRWWPRWPGRAPT